MLNFDHTHYIPILRWKQAEQFALRELQSPDKSRMTPLLELVPDAFDLQRYKKTITVEEKLSKTAKEISQNWGQKPFFLDLWLLAPELRSEDRRHPLKVLGENVRSYQLSSIPVTGLNREDSYQLAVASLVQTNRQGLCIRLFREDLQHSRLAGNLKRLLGNFGLHPEEVDLLIDYQIIDSSAPTFTNLCTIIPVLHRWRTFSVASGTFPEDLTGFSKNRQYELERLDWLMWEGQITAKPILPRRPTYSDYTIQHPVYLKRSGFMNYSGSIRYTHDKYWVIMRGEGVFNPDGPRFDQYPANAQLLCDRSEFCGPNYSYGDKYIKERSLELENPQGIKKPGNAKTWLQAGINHHLTFVVRQIANLFGVSTDDAL